MLYLGYDLMIENNCIILDKELTIKVNQNDNEIQKLLPWKEGDNFELLVVNGRTVLKKIEG
jgi:hypothetical protein